MTADLERARTWSKRALGARVDITLTHKDKQMNEQMNKQKNIVTNKQRESILVDEVVWRTNCPENKNEFLINGKQLDNQP